MFKKSMLIAAMLITSSAAFGSANARSPIIGCDPTTAPGGVCVVDHQPAPPIRDHRCPASQGGNCVGPEPAVIQCLVAPCPVIPPPPRQPTQCNDPRLCDDFGHPRPPRRPPVVIIDPIDMGPRPITALPAAKVATLCATKASAAFCQLIAVVVNIPMKAKDAAAYSRSA